MGKMSFSGSKAAAPADESAPASVENGGLKRENTPAPTGAETVAPDRQVGRPMDPAFTGDWNRKDIRLPRLNLIHKTSADALIDQFGIGAFAFGKEVKLSDGKTPFRIIAMRAAKDYVQKLPFGDPETPAVFNTVEEVENAGGTLEFNKKNGNNYFQPRAHIQVAFAAPDGLRDEDLALFPYEFEGKPWGMAMFTVASSAYTSVGIGLSTLCNNNKVMRKGPLFGALDLTSEIRKNAKNSWHVPVIRYAGENSEDLVKFLTNLL
jgi:hypothetical protein